jgi:hypothetical protein
MPSFTVAPHRNFARPFSVEQVCREFSRFAAVTCFARAESALIPFLFIPIDSLFRTGIPERSFI